MPRIGLSMMLVLTACSTVSQTGALKKVEPFSHRCEEENEKATLVRQGELLKFDVLAYGTCRDGEIRTFTNERYNESWVFAYTAGAIVGSIIEVPVIAALYWLSGKSSQSNLGNAAWLLLLPGIGVGTAVGTAVGKTTVRLADGPDEQVVAVTNAQPQNTASEGTLMVEEEPALKWKLDHGTVTLPIEALWRYDLSRLLVNGILLDYDEPSRSIIDRLGACRRAVKGWSPGAEGSCVQQRQRRDDALFCQASGFVYANEVLARTAELGCQPR